MQSVYFLPGKDRELYAEACGRMRAMEKRLVDRERLGELVEALDVPSVLSMLRRWGWLAERQEDGGDWERAVAAGLAASDIELLSLDPRPLVTTLLVMRYEMINLGAVLKARAQGEGETPPLHPRGLSSAARLEEVTARMDFSSYPPPLAGCLQGLRSLASGSEPRKITAAVVRAHRRALFEAADGDGSVLLADFLRHETDVENIKLRLRALRQPALWEGGDSFLPGGSVGEPVAGAVDEGDLALRLSRTVYGPLLERSRGGDGRLSAAMLEKECDDFLTRLLEPAKYVSLGPEPIWAYWRAREVDGKNIRTAVLGILAGVPRAELHRRMRRTYA